MLNTESSLIYRPDCWLEPIRPTKMFPQTGPLEVELGSGDGSFLAQWSTRWPDRTFIGVERLLGRLRKLDRKAQRAGLTNLRLMRIEAGYFLEFLLPPASTEMLHVYFPDPWPKRKHHKHRLVNVRFPELAARVLAPGGLACFRTDDQTYFLQIQEVFASDPRFVALPTPPALLEHITDFEAEFHARGIPTLHAAYRLQPVG